MRFVNRKWPLFKKWLNVEVHRRNSRPPMIDWTGYGIYT